MKIKKIGIFSLIVFILLIVQTTTKSYSNYIDDIVINTEYSNRNDVPKEIEYEKDGFQGTLQLKEIRVSSGNPPKSVSYNETVTYSLQDYCIWDSSTSYMNYKYETGGVPNSKTVFKDGCSFTVRLVSTKEYHQHITSYAAPNYYLRGKTSYGGFTISENSWIGNNSVTNGQQYHTATHYYRGTYQGSYTSSDTRKYVGVYGGNVYNHEPINDSFGIEGAEYTDSRGYWVRPNKNFTIWAKAHDEVKNDKYKPDKIYYSVGDSSIGVSGKIETNSSQQKFYYEGQGTSTYMPLLGVSFLNESQGTSCSKLNTKLTKDNLHFNYSFTSSKSQGGYVEASTWKQMFKVHSDGTAPDGKVNYDYNEKSADMKINVSNIVETGSGVKKIWVEYSLKDNPQKVIKEDLVLRNGCYEGGKNLYNSFNGNSDIVNFKVTSMDNVGNTRVLLNSSVEVFIIRASIVKVLPDHKPIFRRGEKGILKINTYGGVEKLKITFPENLSKFDNTLNKEIVLTPKKHNNPVDYGFFVPLDSIPKKDYTVEVKGYLNNKSKTVYCKFEVLNETILDNVRTRIRKPK